MFDYQLVICIFVRGLMLFVVFYISDIHINHNNID